jgi:hypothetical protein
VTRWDHSAQPVTQLDAHIVLPASVKTFSRISVGVFTTADRGYTRKFAYSYSIGFEQNELAPRVKEGVLTVSLLDATDEDLNGEFGGVKRKTVCEEEVEKVKFFVMIKGHNITGYSQTYHGGTVVQSPMYDDGTDLIPEEFFEMKQSADWAQRAETSRVNQEKFDGDRRKERNLMTALKIGIVALIVLLVALK